MHFINARQATVVSNGRALDIPPDIRAEIEATLFKHRETSAAIASLWAKSGRPMHGNSLESYVTLLPPQWQPEPQEDASRQLDRRILLQVAERLTKRKVAAAKKRKSRLQDGERAEFAPNSFGGHQQSCSGLEIASFGRLTQLGGGGSSVYPNDSEQIDDVAAGSSQSFNLASQHDSDSGKVSNNDPRCVLHSRSTKDLHTKNQSEKRRKAAFNEIRRIVNEKSGLYSVFFSTYPTKFEFFVQLRGYLEAGNSLPSSINVNTRTSKNRVKVYMEMAEGVISGDILAADGLHE